MRTQLQAVSLRIQTLRSNQQMAEAMKGATRVSDLLVLEIIRRQRALMLPITLLIGHGYHESINESASYAKDYEGV
jgi:hypothetical protein